ncbi:MAG TPA: BACON domain-containing carbohydrate-binding protein [Vicinamibacterales bacterium]|nr:BACON domain-containing carbohydrate-binding protein [Vicinamibacterales bacterium]
MMEDVHLARRIACAASVAAVLAAFAACGGSGQTFTTPTSLTKCAVTLAVGDSTLPANGASGHIGVTTERECQWTASSDAAWLSITAGASGQGNGTVDYTAAANVDPVARTGNVTLNGQRAPFTQAAGACRVDLSAASASFPQAGGAGSVDVHTSSALCQWTASSDKSWIVLHATSGKGPGTVGFDVAPATAPRTGAITIGGASFSVIQSQGCTYAIAPASYEVGSAGGQTTVAVTAGADCPWTAASNADWVTVAQGATGTAAGTVTLVVSPTDGPSRATTVVIAGQSFAITQSPGCSLTVSPTSLSVPASASADRVTVSGGAGCPWSASTGASWITITSGASGQGNGTVTFSVAADTGPSRSGTLTVAGRTVTVSQVQGCAFTISPESQSVPDEGGSASTSVTTADGCGWTATSNASWIKIKKGERGTGPGRVDLQASANSGPSRSGTATIAGRTFTLEQTQGCKFSLNRTSVPIGGNGDTFAIDVKADAGCAWTAASHVSWIAVTAGSNGSGHGTVTITIAANTGPPRSGTLTIADQTFTVNQTGGCAYRIAPQSQSVPAGGGTVPVSVMADAGCAWQAAASAPWIAVSSGASGSGNGTVVLTVLASDDQARTGSAIIAGQTFTVQQGSGCAIRLSEGSQAFPVAGGPASVGVATGAACPWTAVSNAPWIAITSGGSGTGNGAVGFSVAANSGAARASSIAVNGITFNVTQASGCSYNVAPGTIPEPAGGGDPSVSVATTNDCGWTSASGASWIAIVGSGSGSGNGAVQLHVDANAGAPRSGGVTIAGTAVTVTQDGACSFALSSGSASVGEHGGKGEVDVTAGPGCAWTATSNVPWVTISDGATGMSNGKVHFEVDGNDTGITRTGTLTIAGQTFTIVQGS